MLWGSGFCLRPLALATSEGNCNSNGLESRILPLAPTGKVVKFPNPDGRKRHKNIFQLIEHFPLICRNLVVSHPESTVKLEKEFQHFL